MLKIVRGVKQGVMLLTAGVMCLALPVSAELSIWTQTDCTRVLRADAPGKAKAAHVKAARNEWESFQILMRSDLPIAGINLKAGTLLGPKGSASKLRVELYRQHQLELLDASYRNEAFQPGWYPDALIPFVHPLMGTPLMDGRLKAVPFDLPAEQTHGFWVDVYVPSEAQAGEYRGKILVQAGGQTQEVPVVVTVWDFALPPTLTFQSSMGAPSQRLRAYYKTRAESGKEPEPANWADMDRQIAQLFDEHRLNATPFQEIKPVEQADGTFLIPMEKVEAFREFVDTYHLNAYAITHPKTVVKDLEKQRSRLNAWLQAWNQFAQELKRPQVMLYVYLRDEPNDAEAYDYVQKWGSAIRAANSVVKVLVTEQTKSSEPAWGDLYGAVDVWCTLFPLHDQETAVQRQALGETVWMYTALCQRSPPTPWWQIDFPLLNYRVPMWIGWRYQMRGILYWGGMCFWNQVDDPWSDPKTLDRRKAKNKQLYNGDGSLLYPGRAVGYDGIVASLRLKALRDGIEDYELLAILERAGQSKAADEIVKPLAEDWFQWEKDPSAYEAAREKLAKLILALPKSK